MLSVSCLEFGTLTVNPTGLSFGRGFVADTDGFLFILGLAGIGFGLLVTGGLTSLCGSDGDLTSLCGGDSDLTSMRRGGEGLSLLVFPSFPTVLFVLASAKG